MSAAAASRPAWRGMRRLVLGDPMRRYLLSRLAQGCVVIFGAITISFLLTSVTGNPADILASRLLPQEQIEALERELGYDKPLGERYVNYLKDAVRADFGDSYRFQEPALTSVGRALPYTLMLAGGAMALALAISLPVAIFSVLRRETLADRIVRRLLIVGQGLPEFWLALMLTLVFAVWLQLLPGVGFSGPESLILPVLALGLPLTPTMVRILRGQLLDVMCLEFIDALRAKGLSELDIVVRHGLRNSLAPFVTLLALQAGLVLGGTLIVEAVFAWPGIGTLALSAVGARDLTVVQAIIVLVAAGYVLLNLLADLFVIWIDPRVRIGRA